MRRSTLCPRRTFWIALRQLRINHPDLPTPIINRKKRALDVAVIGAPNVGKSLLTNQIVRAAVSAVSSKMDTTTKNNEAIVTEDDVQMVVVDSPGTIGLGHAKEMMGRSGQDRILSDPEEAITRSQHILVVQDATATGDYIHHRVLHLLHRHSHIPSSLVFNKIDLVTKRTDLLELTRILTNGKVGEQPIKVAKNTIGRLGSSLNNKQELHLADLKENNTEWMTKYRQLLTRPTHECGYAETKRLFMDIRGWSHFSAVFFASALTGEGVQPIRNHLKSLAEEREWRMDENAVTTKTPQAICIESVRAALLDTLPGDIAYKLRPKISEWSQEGEVLQIVVEVPCEKERWAKLIIGKSGGSRMIEIGKRVNEQMSTLFQRQLFIRILVKYKGRVVNFSPMNIQQKIEKR